MAGFFGFGRKRKAQDEIGGEKVRQRLDLEEQANLAMLEAGGAKDNVNIPGVADRNSEDDFDYGASLSEFKNMRKQVSKGRTFVRPSRITPDESLDENGHQKVLTVKLNSSMQCPYRSAEHNLDMKRMAGGRRHLLNLPLAIRARIFKTALVTSERWPGGITVCAKSGDPSCSVPLLRVSRQVREEAQPIYHVGNSFLVTINNFNAAALLPWWTKFRHIRLRARDRYPIRVADGSAQPNPLAVGSFRVQLDDNPHWNNLVQWLRLYHEGELFSFHSCDIPPCAAPAKHRMLGVAAAFQTLREVSREDLSWDVAKKIFGGTRTFLVRDDKQWGFPDGKEVEVEALVDMDIDDETTLFYDNERIDRLEDYDGYRHDRQEEESVNVGEDDTAEEAEQDDQDAEHGDKDKMKKSLSNHGPQDTGKKTAYVEEAEEEQEFFEAVTTFSKSGANPGAAQSPDGPTPGQVGKEVHRPHQAGSPFRPSPQKRPVEKIEHNDTGATKGREAEWDFLEPLDFDHFWKMGLSDSWGSSTSVQATSSSATAIASGPAPEESVVEKSLDRGCVEQEDDYGSPSDDERMSSLIRKEASSSAPSDVFASTNRELDDFVGVGGSVHYPAIDNDTSNTYNADRESVFMCSRNRREVPTIFQDAYRSSSYTFGRATPSPPSNSIYLSQDSEQTISGDETPTRFQNRLETHGRPATTLRSPPEEEHIVPLPWNRQSAGQLPFMATSAQQDAVGSKTTHPRRHMSALESIRQKKMQSDQQKEQGKITDNPGGALGSPPQELRRGGSKGHHAILAGRMGDAAQIPEQSYSPVDDDLDLLWAQTLQPQN